MHTAVHCGDIPNFLRLATPCVERPHLNVFRPLFATLLSRVCTFQMGQFELYELSTAEAAEVLPPIFEQFGVNSCFRLSPDVFLGFVLLASRNLAASPLSIFDSKSCLDINHISKFLCANLFEK